MARYVVFMREDDGAWMKRTKDERTALMVGYEAWFGGLKTSGKLVGGAAIAAGGRILRSVDGAIVDAPMEETKQTATGYFVIEVTDEAEARSLMRGCPALAHGETVELRKVATDEDEH